MKLYIDKGLYTYWGYHDTDGDCEEYTLSEKVSVDIRLEEGKLSLDLSPSDVVQICYRRQTAHEILRIYLGDYDSRYILEIDKVKIVNIEERK